MSAKISNWSGDCGRWAIYSQNNALSNTLRRNISMNSAYERFTKSESLSVQFLNRI